MTTSATIETGTGATHDQTGQPVSAGQSAPSSWRKVLHAVLAAWVRAHAGNGPYPSL